MYLTEPNVLRNCFWSVSRNMPKKKNDRVVVQFRDSGHKYIRHSSKPRRGYKKDTMLTSSLMTEEFIQGDPEAGHAMGTTASRWGWYYSPGICVVVCVQCAESFAIYYSSLLHVDTLNGRDETPRVLDHFRSTLAWCFLSSVVIQWSFINRRIRGLSSPVVAALLQTRSPPWQKAANLSQIY